MLSFPRLEADEALRALGYSAWRPGQQEAVEGVALGRDGLVIIPTGGGKSAIYQSLSLMFDGLCLVISPLISLMVDQVDALKKRGVKAAYINSAQNAHEKFMVESSFLTGGLDILYVSPERLQNPEFAAQIRSVGLSVLVVDEAHCFPLGTPVLTKEGNRPIETIRPGDVVLSKDNDGVIQWRTVKNLWVNPQKETFVTVSHTHGKFVCTANHEIWTDTGYVRASSLQPGHRLSIVRHAIEETKIQPVLQHSLCAQSSGEQSQVSRTGADHFEASQHRPTATRLLAAHDSKQSGGIRSSTPSDVETAQGTAFYWEKRRDRQRTFVRPELFALAHQTFYGSSDSNSNRHPQRVQNADVLQSRPGLYSAEVSHRDRRECPPRQEEGTGLQEGDGFEAAWVVGVEIHQPTGAGESAGNCGLDPVFDLEVEEFHNYVANGVVVHNCVSKWGHDFRSDYMRIGAWRTEMGNPLTVALTATATPEVQDDIVASLRLDNPLRVLTGFDRPNLFLSRYKMNHSTQRGIVERTSRIESILRKAPAGAQMVYCATRKHADELAAIVGKSMGRPCIIYHAGMKDRDRKSAQERFLTEASPIVVATCAFGMGIDRPDVRTVIHLQHPGNMENYYQEIGRAGRDGLPSQGILLWHYSDRGLQEFFIKCAVWEPSEYEQLYKTVNTGGHLRDSDKSGLEHMQRFRVIQKDIFQGWKVIEPWGGPQSSRMMAWARELYAQKQAQLKKMCNYIASDRKCRREILLEHFGEKVVNRPAMCCDICNKQSTL